LTGILSSPGNRASTTKSSLLSQYKTNSYNGNGTRKTSRQRRPKSVTWDREEPQVLEFELVTPDPSVDGSPRAEYDSDDYEDDEDDEDEEDLDNTPVIEPDGWTLAHQAEEAYRSTPSPNGGRPLPPIPPALSRADTGSPSGARPLPTPPVGPAQPLTQTGLQNQATMPMEERMRRMMGGDTPVRRMSYDANASRRRSRLDGEFHEGLGIALSKEHARIPGLGLDPEGITSDRDESSPNSNREPDIDSNPSTYSDPSTYSNPSTYGSRSDYEPAQLSRESIRRQVEERRLQSIEDREYHNSSRFSYYSTSTSVSESPIPPMKREIDDDETSTSSYAPPTEVQNLPERPASRFSRHSPDLNHETASEASTYNDQATKEAEHSDQSDHSEKEDEQNTPIQGTTPTPGSPASTATEQPETGLVEEMADLQLQDDKQVGLPELSVAVGGLDLSDFLTQPSPPAANTETKIAESTPEIASATEVTTEAVAESLVDANKDEIEDSDTGSVIRHHIKVEEAPKTRSPSPVAEALATIRAPGGKLKTRASATPADMAAMAAARRQVSGEQNIPPPSRQASHSGRIPSGYRSEGESTGGSSEDEDDDDVDIEDPLAGYGHSSDTESIRRRASSRKLKRKISTTLPALGEFEFDLKLDDLAHEFDRVIEREKRGYLMRQNTKVIHASNRDIVEGEKPSDNVERPGHGHARGQSWSVEPWRSAHRRRSGRDSLGTGGSGRRRTSNGPVPPLPGRDSISSRLPSVSEGGVRTSSIGSAEGDNVERGRLFVKVIGVKDLNLPLPTNNVPTYFCLTLDNGLHCVTTSWLELGKNAPIGQEFELVVLENLEFQLTLQVKLERPPEAPPKTAVSMKAPSLLQGVVARDGSFARSYVSLKDFESKAYGRPLVTDIHCFNEWAVDTASIKSKKGMLNGLQPARKAPYKIGKLEVQLMFIPKPKLATEKDLPKSMNTAIRELREAENIMSREWEGNLSQQGGDCPYWRRRYFKLKGARLTAYHEQTRQPRATINLSKAVKLIDDRQTLVENTVAGPGKTRRKSGFSEDEEGYMFVEEGFRIKFANGEVIDFYADTHEQKISWLQILSETIGHVPDQKGWCQLVLQREARLKAEREKKEAADKARAAQNSVMGNGPTSPTQRRPPPPMSSRRPLPPGGTGHSYR
ncbi:hypothetical protein BZA77DRAFT_250155, partial [Pyronema omphalodes]